MKKLTLLLILLVPVFTFSQTIDVPAEYPGIQQGNDTIQIGYKPKTFKTWVSLRSPPQKLKGSLYQLNDSSMALVTNELIKQNFYCEKESMMFKIDQVKMIKIRRKGSVEKGVLIGALSGVAIGAIWGIIEGSNKPGQIQITVAERAALRGVTCMLPAAAIGALFGSISVEIPINGSQGTYEKNRKKLEKYSVK
ncbi:MAG: hypothetical protein ISR55_12395 [Bacteroidetes bacterium]|nr:hypothetical protein [Bacteroidota bacterium]